MSEIRRPRWLWPAALLLLALAAWYAMDRWRAEAQPQQFATAPVARADVERTVLAAGQLEPVRQVSVGAQVSGQIKRLAVALGQDVKAGELIAEIDSLPQRNALRTAEAALASARAQLAAQQATLAEAEISHRRQRQLLRLDANARAEFDAAEAAWKVAEASVRAQQALIAQQEVAVDTARINLGYTRIVAPMDGRVIGVAVEEGQTVNAVQATPTLVVLARLDTMTVKAEISEADVTRVAPGMPVYFTILGEPGRRHESRLRSVDPATDAFSASSDPHAAAGAGSASASPAVYYYGRFEVPNPGHRLRAAMTAEVHIIEAAARDVPTIPVAALGRALADGRHVVRVLGEDGQAREREVETGLSDDIRVQVLAGLVEGEQVVVADAAGDSAARQGGGRGARGPLGF